MSGAQVREFDFVLYRFESLTKAVRKSRLQVEDVIRRLAVKNEEDEHPHKRQEFSHAH